MHRLVIGLHDKRRRQGVQAWVQSYCLTPALQHWHSAAEKILSVALGNNDWIWRR